MPIQAIVAARFLFGRHLFGLVFNDLNHRFDERFLVSQVPLRCRVQEWTISFAASQTKSVNSALTNAEFHRASCSDMSLPFGPRDHSECPYRVTSRVFAGTDSDSLEQVIAAAYRQVFGNCHVMDLERSSALEAQLKDGRLCVREFVCGLAKTFYRTRFYSNVRRVVGSSLPSSMSSVVRRSVRARSLAALSSRHVRDLRP